MGGVRRRPTDSKADGESFAKGVSAHRVVAKEWSALHVGWTAGVLMLALACCWFFFLQEGRTAVTAESSVKEVLLSGYVPEYRLEHVEKNLQFVGKHYSELILFSVHPSASGAVAHEPGIAAPALSFATKAKKHGVRRVLLSIGGGGRSHTFSAVLRDAKKRQRFVEELVALCDAFSLDGVDVDWEIPQTPAERALLTLLLNDLSRALRPASRVVTLALHYWDHPEPAALRLVDRINFMTYDFRAREGHSSFKATKEAVEALLARGVPANKVALGVPAYARSAAGDAKTYEELDTILALDADAYRAKGFRFNGRNPCRKKLRWAVERGLAGVFVWEVGQDSMRAGRSLAEAMAREAQTVKENQAN